MIRTAVAILSLSVLACAQFGPLPQSAPQSAPLRLAIAGLVHGHISNFFQAAKNRTDLQIVGIFDPDPELTESYGKNAGIPPEAQFRDLGAMLDKVKPEAVAAFTTTADHAMVVEACARRRIPVMMEKPLAVDMGEARAIRKAAADSGIPVMVNYETTWYKSSAEIWNIVKERKAIGEIRRMVAMDGHPGPKETHVQPEFLAWLIDPAKNGAGALFDFGCYGANLMTWLMDNQRPIAVTAITQTEKPDIYAPVDDESTILVQYPKAQGVIQASWNWPTNRKDLEVYGQTGYAIATGGNNLKVRVRGSGETTPTLDELPAVRRDAITYLTGIARGHFKPEGLNSLENNMIVTEILDAARESARTGRKISLPR